MSLRKCNGHRSYQVLLGIITLAGLCLTPFIPDSTAQPNPDIAHAPFPPGVQVRLDASPKVAAIGDPIRLELDILMPMGWRADIPALEKQIGDFFILEFRQEPDTPPSVAPVQNQPQAPANQRAQIVVAVYKTGTFTFPPVQIRLRTADEKVFTVSSPPAKIEIRSVLAEKDRDLKDLKKQEEIPESVRWMLWATTLLMAVILAAAGWYFWRKRRGHRTLPPPSSPPDLLEMSESELRALLARGLPEDGSVKEFYVLLSEIVKRILEAGYGIHTAEQTTSEIMESLRDQSGRAPGNMDRIESFLLRCDLVKFAKYIPVKAEHESAAEDARWILESIRRFPGSAGVSPAAASDN